MYFIFILGWQVWLCVEILELLVTKNFFECKTTALFFRIRHPWDFFFFFGQSFPSMGYLFETFLFIYVIYSSLIHYILTLASSPSTPPNALSCFYSLRNFQLFMTLPLREVRKAGIFPSALPPVSVVLFLIGLMTRHKFELERLNL